MNVAAGVRYHTRDVLPSLDIERSAEGLQGPGGVAEQLDPNPGALSEWMLMLAALEPRMIPWAVFCC